MERHVIHFTESTIRYSSHYDNEQNTVIQRKGNGGLKTDIGMTSEEINGLSLQNSRNQTERKTN